MRLSGGREGQPSLDRQEDLPVTELLNGARIFTQV